MEEKKKKKSFFSLDRHLGLTSNISENFSFFKSLARFVAKTPKRPITSLYEAKIAWGIETFSEEYVRRFCRTKLLAGMFAAILFCTLLFLMFYNYFMDSFGLFSGIGYTLGLFASVSVALVCLWQSDMLSSETFTPFHEYVLHWKWMISAVLVASCVFMQYEAVLAAEIDLPDTKLSAKYIDDLSAVFVGHIIGGPWSAYAYAEDTSFTAIFQEIFPNIPYFTDGGMSSVLLPILSVLNIGALTFVTVFAVYIYTFGTVQIAHTGDWKDNQIFSTFWSPVRTSAAIALCSPLSNSVSLLQHFILIAIAMSINLANNVSDCFTEYLVKNESLFHLSLPTVSSGREHFSKIFSAVLNGTIIQVVGTNIHGETLGSPGIAVGEITQINRTIPTLSQNNGLFGLGDTDKRTTLSVRTLQMAAPGSFYSQQMPSIDITSEHGETLIAAYTVAIQNMYTDVYAMTSDYISKDIANRKNKEQLEAKLKKIYADFTTAVKNAASSIDINTSSLQLVSDLKERTDKYGWLTLGVYPFIVAKQQGDLQKKASVSIDIQNKANLGTLKKVTTGGSEEYEIAYSYVNEISKIIKKLHKTGEFFDEYASGAFGTSSDSIVDQLAYKALGYTGLYPGDLIDELQTYNSVAVLHSKGWLCIKVAKSMLNSLSGGKSIEGMFGTLTETMYGRGLTDEESREVQSLGGWTFVIYVCCGMLFFFGISCTFLLPALPILFWARATASWAVLIVQTMMGAPFWAAAHILPEGIGLAGQHARRGYILLLDVFLRPCLLVCGAIMVMLLIEVWTKILAKILLLWAEFTQSATDWDIAGIFFTTGICLFVIYSTIKWLYIQAIGDFPQRVIQWCGGQSADSGIQDVAQSVQSITAKMQDFVNRAGGGGYDMGGLNKK